jgi:hypothetical protein
MSAAFTRQIFAWLAQVNVDDEMPASAAKLAIAFTRFFNEAQDGAAWASLRTLGTAAAISKTNVEKLLRQFEARDHLRIEWGKPGRGSSNRCWMVMKECPPQSGHSPANCPPQSGHSRRRKSPLLSDESPLQSGQTLRKRIHRKKDTSLRSVSSDQTKFPAGWIPGDEEYANALKRGG